MSRRVATFNPLDRLIGWFSPRSGLRRLQARQVLAYYDASRVDPQRKQRRSTGSGDAEIGRAGRSLRDQARYLDANHDLAIGVLNTLVANVVGPKGVGIEPQPRTRDGKIHRPTAQAIRALLRDWQRRPEVTWCHDWTGCQHLMGRTWLRDGEALGHFVEGESARIDHGTRVPLSIEMLEPDYLPMDLNGSDPLITQGIETNAWGRPVAYHMLKAHPGNDSLWPSVIRAATDTKRVPSRYMLHLALRNRMHQLRGASVFAAVLGRLDDLKDYEESERIAAKVAASMAAYIKKGLPDLYTQPVSEDGSEQEARDMRFRPGMVFDDLRPGEEIGTIDTRRPSQQLEPHRNGQLRAIAAGTYCTYSSASKNYDGTYSAQRQELVEGYGVYGILQSYFIGRFVQPVYERVITAALSAGQLAIPADVDPVTVDDAMYIAPQMPWIDPDKEAKAWERLERNGHASGPEIVRKRGQDPAELIEQESEWRAQWAEKDIRLGVEAPADPAQEPDTNADSNDQAA